MGTDPPIRSIPPAVVILTILLALGVGGGLIWWNMRDTPAEPKNSPAVTDDSRPTPAPARRRPAPRPTSLPASRATSRPASRPASKPALQPPEWTKPGPRVTATHPATDQVGSQGRGVYVRTGQIYLRIDQGPTTRLTGEYYDAHNWCRPEDYDLNRAWWGILQDSRVSDALGFTQEQRKPLLALSVGPTMVPPDPADAARLAALADAYRNAPRGDASAVAEQALVDALKALAEKNLPASRAAWLARIEKVKAIITPEQVETFRGLYGRTPASQP